MSKDKIVRGSDNNPIKRFVKKPFKEKNEWSSKFDAINFEPFKGTKEPRYYQEIAINNALDAIADKQQRILLTLATGTGKTVIAFHIACLLYTSDAADD